MSNVKFLQQAFVGGEVAPQMRGRIEDVGYANGLALCRNFLVRPQGMVENRAGLRFVAEVKDSSKRVRLIPFSFSGEQTMVIELGDKYARFHTGAATLYEGNAPYEIATPYAAEHVMDIHHVQSADVLTLVHPKYPPQELRRLGATNWKLEAISFVPKFEPPTDLSASDSRVPLASRVQRSDLASHSQTKAIPGRRWMALTITWCTSGNRGCSASPDTPTKPALKTAVSRRTWRKPRRNTKPSSTRHSTTPRRCRTTSNGAALRGHRPNRKKYG